MQKIVSRLQDEKGQMWDYVIWIIVVCLIVGILITQAGPIIWNHIAIRGTVNDVLDEAVFTYQTSRGDMGKVEAAVMDLLDKRGARMVGTIELTRGSAGEPGRISISVRKIVNTYTFERVGYLSRFTEARASGERTLP